MATALHAARAVLHNFCTRHLSSEVTEDGRCLGCVVERERENNSWWVKSAHYTPPEQSSGMTDEAFRALLSRPAPARPELEVGSTFSKERGRRCSERSGSAQPGPLNFPMNRPRYCTECWAHGDHDILAVFATKEGDLCLFHVKEAGLNPEDLTPIAQPASAMPVQVTRAERLDAVEHAKEEPTMTKYTEAQFCTVPECGKRLRVKQDGTYNDKCTTCQRGCKPGYIAHKKKPVEGQHVTPLRGTPIVERRKKAKAKKAARTESAVQAPASEPTVAVNVTEAHLDYFWQQLPLQSKAAMFSQFLASGGL